MMKRTDSETEIVIIAAVAVKNRVIGKGNDLPWHIPADLRRFKRLTLGHPMIMGRRTFESIIHQFGAPLPNRRLLVVTSKGKVDGHPDIEAFTNVDAALEAASGAQHVFIGGGASIYAQFLEVSDRMELTLVKGDYEGDTYFPEYEHLIGPVFEKTAEESHEEYSFVTYERLAVDS